MTFLNEQLMTFLNEQLMTLVKEQLMTHNSYNISLCLT